MPGVTGFDARWQLGAGKVALPIIFITALDDPSDGQRAMEAGASESLRKPFGDEEFLTAVGAAVGAVLAETRW